MVPARGRIVRGEQPAVSSDGKTIAFVRDKDVFTIGVDGDGKRNLTRDLREGSGSDVGFLSPSFSPDAKWIVLNSNLDAPRNDEFNDDLYLLKANGKRLERLTSGGIEEFSPTFSPTGQQIAYVGDTERGARKDGIYVIDADGSNASQLFKVKRPGAPTWQPAEP